MRVGNFDVSFEPNNCFSPAEIEMGAAKVFNSIQIKNVRGSEKDWITFSLLVEGKPSPAKSWRVEQLPANNADQENMKSMRLEHEFQLKPSFSPGQYRAKITVVAADNSESCIHYGFTVLPPDMIPRTYPKAACLSAWVYPNNPELRTWVNQIAPENSTPEAAARAIYADLCKRGLTYQKTVTDINPDYQYVSGPLYALRHGGSCVDLSLLFASLLFPRRVHPVLLLFEDHMAVGCFTDETRLPENETVQGANDILFLIGRKELLVWDAVDITRSGVSFDDSRTNLQTRLANAGSGVCLVNVSAVLKNHPSLPVMEPTPPKELICHDCCHRFPAPFGNDKPVCPACGCSEVAPAASNTARRYERYINLEEYDWQSLKLREARDGWEITGLKGEAKDEIRIPPEVDGRVVWRIGDKAFLNSKVSVFYIPDCVTEIGDYAFYGCENLKTVDLPQDLSVLGTGTFGSSGLECITVPGSVIRLSRLAFKNCQHLASVTLEEGIRWIGERAFEACPCLPSIKVPSTAKCEGDIRGRQ